MSPRTGLVLRLLGPLIEVACAIQLTRPRQAGQTILGTSVDHLLYAGMFLGGVMVFGGLFLSRPKKRRPRDPG